MHPSLSRRRFLITAAASGCGAGSAWSRPRSDSDDALSSSRPAQTREVIDTHTHFYDPARPEGVPWPPNDDRLLYRTVLPRDYLGLPVPQPVTGTVVVEASPWVEDNQWILNLAAQHAFIRGLVGNLPVGTPEFAGHLERFSKNPAFRGVRIRDRTLDGFLEKPQFVSDLRLLASKDLALDLVGGLEILSFAKRAQQEVPTLRIVIDHLAGVRIDGRRPPGEWTRSMQALARHEGVYAKLSGLVEGTGRTDGSAPRDVPYYREVLEVMWEAFGPGRLLYASNWPVSERFASLGTVQGIVQEFANRKGAEVESAIMAGNARRVYRLLAGAEAAPSRPNQT